MSPESGAYLDSEWCALRSRYMILLRTWRDLDRDEGTPRVEPRPEADRTLHEQALEERAEAIRDEYGKVLDCLDRVWSNTRPHLKAAPVPEALASTIRDVLALHQETIELSEQDAQRTKLIWISPVFHLMNREYCATVLSDMGIPVDAEHQNALWDVLTDNEGKLWHERAVTLPRKAFEHWLAKATTGRVQTDTDYFKRRKTKIPDKESTFDYVAMAPAVHGRVSGQTDREDVDALLAVCESSDLTRREVEVLVADVNGDTPEEAALRLGISPATFYVHRRNLRKKLGRV